MTMILLEKIDQEMGGGVCIYLRSSINYKIRNDLVPSELEAVCIEIIKPHSKPFFVTTVYRPPNASSKFFDYFEKLIKAIDNENKEMYILGDLNCDVMIKILTPQLRKLSPCTNCINSHN